MGKYPKGVTLMIFFFSPESNAKTGPVIGEDGSFDTPARSCHNFPEIDILLTHSETDKRIKKPSTTLEFHRHGTKKTDGT
jgi:hypothetical protein